MQWTGTIEAPASGSAVLQTISDDGIRVWFDNRLLINNWILHGPTKNNVTVTFVAGRRHAITIEYYESGGGAVAKLNWQTPGSGSYVPVPAQRLYR